MNYSHVTVVGRLARDPSLKVTQNNKPWCSGAVAVESGWGDNKQVNFFDFTLWGKAAETMGRYCNKGDEVLLSGELRQDRWETDAGDRRSTVKINAFRFEFGRKKGEGGGKGGGGDRSRDEQDSSPPGGENPFETDIEKIDADEVPF